MACPVLADVDLTDLSNHRNQIFDEHLGSSINILGEFNFGGFKLKKIKIIFIFHLIY